jgi:glycosyltransferase involved in cell wall biosynthesis
LPREREKLNILFLPAWYPSAERPVLGTFVREHAKAASRFHHVTVLYASRTDADLGARWKVANDSLEDGIRTVRVHWKGPKQIALRVLVYVWVMLAAYRYIVRTGYQPDILHAHIYVAAPAAAFLGMLFRKPVVATEQTSSFPQGDVKGLQLLAARSAFRRAAMILPVSAWLQESMQTAGVRGRFRVVPNTIDTELFFPASTNLPAQGLPKLLTVGLLTEAKGIPVLLRAVHAVVAKGMQLHLDIVGDGRERPDYEKLAGELGLEDAVTFHGLVSKDEVGSMMRGSSFYLQPSLWETFSAAIIEAMACGKPVVATQIPVFEEKVGEDMGILVPPGDVDALASAIEDMLGRYRSYDPQRIAAFIRSRYSHDAVGKDLSAVYAEVWQQQ